MGCGERDQKNVQKCFICFSPGTGGVGLVVCIGRSMCDGDCVEGGGRKLFGIYVVYYVRGVEVKGRISGGFGLVG